jgi:hypothetical protein
MQAYVCIHFNNLLTPCLLGTPDALLSHRNSSTYSKVYNARYSAAVSYVTMLINCGRIINTSAANNSLVLELEFSHGTGNKRN